MSTNSDNVRVAGSGEVLIGATSATAPTGTAGSTTGFTGLGYISEDGITESLDRTLDEIRAWQNRDVVRRVVTEASVTYSFTLLETSVEAVELFYGTEVTQSVTEGNYVVVPSSTGDHHAFIIDVIDGANLKRIYLPDAEVTETGDVTYSSDGAVGYEVTITGYHDSGLGGSAEVWDTALKS